MDWVKLTRTHPDLAGLNGQSNRRLIPMSKVKQHQSEGTMWTVVHGRVYNISPYMKFHPGGMDTVFAVSYVLYLSSLLCPVLSIFVTIHMLCSACCEQYPCYHPEVNFMFCLLTCLQYIPCILKFSLMKCTLLLLFKEFNRGKKQGPLY